MIDRGRSLLRRVTAKRRLPKPRPNRAAKLVVLGICACLGVGAALFDPSGVGHDESLQGSTGETQLPRSRPLTVMHWLSSKGERAAIETVRIELGRQGQTWREEPMPDVGTAQAAATNRILGGASPDIFQFSVGSRLQELASHRMVAPAPVDPAALDRFLPPVVANASKFNGSYVAVPFAVMGENWMFYNQTVLDRFGLGVPGSWPDLISAAGVLKANGVTPIALGGQPWQERILFNSVLLGVGGRDFYNRIYSDLDPPAFGSDVMLEVFKVFGALRPFVDQGSPGRSWDQTTLFLVRGEAAFLFMGDWAKSQIYASGATLGDDIGCSLAPASEQSYIIAVDAFTFAVPRDKAAAAGQRLFADVLLSPEIQIAFNQRRGSIPARTDLPDKGFDVCARKAKAVMRNESAQLASIGLFGLPGGVAGAVEDAVSQFWNDPGMTPEKGQALFQSTVLAFK